MTSSLEQSIKEKIKTLAKQERTPFSQLWRTLILERFLIRLNQSPFNDGFVLKGGTLLAKYLPLGRETKDLDFLIEKLSNSEKSLETVLDVICSINIDDGFSFEIVKISRLNHDHMAYPGVQIILLARFGGTKTNLRIDLGFGDVVEAIEQPIGLMATRKGPLFESQVSLRCYPKEFIFAEKLETIVFRGESNTRMKDFHDLYSLITFGDLNEDDIYKAIRMVFNHRRTPIETLPITFDGEALDLLNKTWKTYLRRLKSSQKLVLLPTSIEEVIESINRWLELKTALFEKKTYL